MKKIILIIYLLLFGSITFAQDLNYSEVPEEVKASFVDIYPDIEKVVWEKEENNYEAFFNYNNIETSLILDSTGKVLLRKEEISANTLPVNIKEYSSQNLNSDKINKAIMLTNEFGVIIFKVEIDGTDYLFGVEGNFISKESEYDYYEKYEDNGE
ncbi:MAG TPA: hypothetical protein PKA90_02805 [Ignavibacteria bacterium]|nr:hypothetical protein [Ignavibacteria bacterium]HMR39338.1 hypothetical protein [Ignavibacteria bacterium]